MSFLSRLLCGTALAAVALPAWAQTTGMQPLGTPGGQPPTSPPATMLDAVEVTATRTPKTLADSPATVSVIEAEELERRNATRVEDIVRYEPGVSMSGSPARTGAGSYVIRGIGDNRVRMQLDGVKVPDFPGSNIGAGNYTRDFIDIDAIKRVELVRGPASALYGSDALGGVVAYTTKDPADYLDMVGKNWFASAKVGYSSADNALSETLTGAFRSGNVEGMLLYTRRDGEELDANAGRSANPQVWRSDSLLGKMTLRASDADRFTLVGEYTQKKVRTDLDSEEVTTPGAGGGPSSTVFDSRGQDTTQRNRLSLEWAHDAPIGFIDSLVARGYWTQVKRDEDTQVLRSVGAPVPNRYRVSFFNFDQTIWGGDLQFHTARNLFGLEHRFTYGLSADVTDTTRPRARYESNLASGATSTMVAGETFPNKNFPDTQTVQGGVYVQDEIRMGAFTALPALRFDYYRMKPEPDQAFANSSGGTLAVSKLTETSFSPKLGLTYRIDPTYTAFANYAHGFRAPPYDTANFGFSNPVQFYEILPNANLKSERSDGVEGGLRARFGDGSSFSATAFYNRYKDFIDTVVVGVAPTGFTSFQYRNLSDVTIWGAEARGEWRFARDWTLLGNLAFARGENEDTGAPIDSVDPVRAVLGLRYLAPSLRWGGELTGVHAWRHNRVSQPGYFKAPSYTTLDFTMFYEIAPSVTVNAGIFNITDESYYVSQTVTGLAANNANRDLYAQPGRSVGINTTIRF